jgi:tRNA-Thr(GGU) m(6)t(6)A37 methyltransferase TsaA
MSGSWPMFVSTAPLAALAIAAAAMMRPAAVAPQPRNNEMEKQCEELKKEVASLRAELKNRNESSRALTNSDDSTGENELSPSSRNRISTVEDDILDGLLVKKIGTIRSIYRLCVGTPRQGLLAPNARGCIEMEKIGDSSTASSVTGLEGYSHIWILFVFHLNTKSQNSKRIKTKIAPPALGGEKVGIFATRTPHRYNPVGLTLCKLDRIERTRHNKREKVFLHISGLDLVDGTPVLDIKPYVPVYDSVPMDVKVPSWVAGGLATKRNVVISQTAKDELTEILEKDKKALQFYGPKYGEKSVTETVDYAMECICQVLAIDVRSSFQTKKAREGKSQAERANRMKDVDLGEPVASDVCSQQLDNLLIQYTVDEAAESKRSSSEGSGAEDTVTIVSIQLLTKRPESEE